MIGTHVLQLTCGGDGPGLAAEHSDRLRRACHRTDGVVSVGPLDGIADVYDSPRDHPGGDASMAPYGIVTPGPEGLLHPAAGRALARAFKESRADATGPSAQAD